GAGVIGLELGSVWARLGSRVTVIEYLDRILPGMDLEVAKTFQRLLTRQGFAFRLASKVTAAEKQSAKVRLMVEPAAGGARDNLEADVVLMAVGRVPYSEGLGLDEAGIKRDGKGRIEVGKHFETSVKGIYAIGDVIRGAMLAHKAEDEGTMVAELIAGQKPHINYNLIPGVVYTWPEVAAVGQTEEQLKAAGVKYKTGSFPFRAS